MINFDSLTLKALINELYSVLHGARVHKIQQPGKNELVVSIRSMGKNHKLYICADPKYPHAALLSKDGEKLRDLKIPQKPPMFCMLLRKHMESSKITEIRQPGFDRILEIYFESYSEIGAKTPLVLSCEFMGKYSNIILYNYETNVILGCSHTVSSEKSREREVAGGLPFVYPPKQNKIDLNKISENDFYRLIKTISIPINTWLNEKIGFISKSIATEICEFCDIDVNEAAELSSEKINCLYNTIKQTVNLKNLNPSLSKDLSFYSPIGLTKKEDLQKTDSINSMIDKYFGTQVFKYKFGQLKQTILNVVKKELKKQKILLTKHEKTIDLKEKANNYKEFADLIMANLYKIKPKADCISLESYNNSEKVDIPLDPTISSINNAQKYYKLYNKAKVASQHSEKLIQDILNEIQYLESIQESINQAETLQDLHLIKEELINQSYISSKPAKNEKKVKDAIEPAEFISSDGFIIYAGKNNKQNEYILKNSSSEDIWLHSRDVPGSHVIIRNADGKEISETTLYEAVNIAAWYSKGRYSANIPVVFTKRKYVKKPSGAKPGFVIYTNEKSLTATPEEQKIKSLRKKTTLP